MSRSRDINEYIGGVQYIGVFNISQRFYQLASAHES